MKLPYHLVLCFVDFYFTFISTHRIKMDLAKL